MTDAPFSVVIPLYNKRKTIARCLTSVEANDPDLIDEIIVVDDGSTDCSSDAVAEVSRRNTKIRLIQQTNQGVSAARNAGIEAARCAHVLLLDADDEWTPGFASTIAGLRARFPDAVLLATAFRVIWANGTQTQPRLKFMPTNPEGGCIEDYVRCISAAGPPFYPSCVALRRAAFKAAGGFPLGVDHGEDKIFWLRLCDIGRFAWSPRVECLRHQSLGNNSSASWSPDGGRHYLREIQRRLSEVSDADATPSLRRLYEKELGQIGRAAAQKRALSAALGAAGGLLARRRAGLAGQVLLSLLMPAGLYNYMKTTLR